MNSRVRHNQAGQRPGRAIADLHRNSRAGLSLAYPFARKHAARLSFSEGVVTESGGEFRAITLNYLYVIR